MNGVFVDVSSLRKAAKDVATESEFGSTPPNGDGERLRRPNRQANAILADIPDLKLGQELNTLTGAWGEKCSAWAEDAETFGQNLTYYADSLEGTDETNADGIKPEWLDDVPDKDTNDGKVE